MRLRIPDRKPIDYQFPRDNGVWPDHRLRTRITAEMIAWLEPDSAIDPTAGDGSILAAAHALRPIGVTILGDLSVANAERLQSVSAGVETLVTCGTVEDILGPVTELADLIVLTEFMEHVEDPLAILRLARQKGRYLVASSPLWPTVRPMDPNEEHLWQFDAVGYDRLLQKAGWMPVAMIPLYLESLYDFQIWVAR